MQFYARRVASAAIKMGFGMDPIYEGPHPILQPQHTVSCPGQRGLIPWLSSWHLWDELPGVQLWVCKALWKPLPVLSDHRHHPGHAIYQG